MVLNGKMKINILLPNFGEKPVGGFKIAYIYANFFAKSGYKVTIIHAHKTEKDSIYEFIKDLSGVLFHRPNWFHFRKGVRRVYCYRLSSAVIPTADVTIATSWKTAIVLNDLPDSKGKKVYLIQGYEVWGDAKKQDVEATWHYDMHKVVISKWLYNLGLSLGCTDMTYIPNSISFRKYKINNPVSNREKVISMLYSDVAIKNSQMGIDALKSVREHIPDITVKLFGKKPRSKKIPAWMEYYEDPDQQYLVDEIYNKTSIFLCTSHREGFGLPPMEAMACGAVLISTRNGGVEDFAIDGETALLCDTDDSDTMAKCIVELFQNNKKRTLLAKNGYKTVHQFRWKDSFGKFERVIRR